MVSIQNHQNDKYYHLIFLLFSSLPFLISSDFGERTPTIEHILPVKILSIEVAEAKIPL
jgi:hypothetical protein